MYSKVTINRMNWTLGTDWRTNEIKTGYKLRFGF